MYAYLCMYVQPQCPHRYNPHPHPLIPLSRSVPLVFNNGLDTTQLDSAQLAVFIHIFMQTRTQTQILLNTRGQDTKIASRTFHGSAPFSLLPCSL